MNTSPFDASALAAQISAGGEALRRPPAAAGTPPATPVTTDAATAPAAVRNQISPDTMKVFDAVDRFMNLSQPQRLGAFLNLSPEEKTEFAKVVARLGTQGMLGYEEVVDPETGEVRKRDILLAMTDRRHVKPRSYDPDGRPQAL